MVDDRIAAHASLDDVSETIGRTVRWNLLKLVGEYARHNGHADLIREHAVAPRAIGTAEIRAAVTRAEDSGATHHG